MSAAERESMSSLMQQIKATATGNIRAAMPRVLSLVSVDQKIEKDDYSRLIEYWVGVKIGEKVFIKENDPNGAQHAIKNMMHNIRHILYSDMDSLLIELERHLYSEDIDAAKKCLREIKNEVFSF